MIPDVAVSRSEGRLPRSPLPRRPCGTSFTTSRLHALRVNILHESHLRHIIHGLSRSIASVIFTHHQRADTLGLCEAAARNVC